METKQAEEILAYMCELWPSWNVAKQLGGEGEEPGRLVEEWVTFLEELGSYNNAKDAVRMALRGSHYHPTMARLADAHRVIMRRGPARTYDGPQVGQVFVQCMKTTAQGHPDGEPALYGQFYGLYYSARAGVPDVDRQIEHAEEIRQLRTAWEGGLWQIIRGQARALTVRDMQERFREMRQKAGLLRMDRKRTRFAVGANLPANMREAVRVAETTMATRTRR